MVASGTITSAWRAIAAITQDTGKSISSIFLVGNRRIGADRGLDDGEIRVTKTQQVDERAIGDCLLDQTQNVVGLAHRDIGVEQA